MTAMRTLLAVVVAWMSTAALLIGPPAHAEVVVTIHADRTRLYEGEQTRIHGVAAGARAGSVVKLEVRTDGGWRTTDRQRTTSAREYAFRVRPPAGSPRYRVLKARQYGEPRALSPTLTLTVREVYDLTAVATPIDPEDTSSPVEVTVRVPDGFTAWDLRPQRRYGTGAWIAFATTDLVQAWSQEAPHRWSHVFREGEFDLRFRLADDRGQVLATSNVVSLTDPTYEAGTSVDGAPATNGAELPGVWFHLDKGDQVTIGLGSFEGYEPNGIGLGSGDNAQLYGPGGRLLDPRSTGTTPTQPFTAGSTGTYTLVVPDFDRIRVWVSTPHVVFATTNGAPVQTGMTVPGQRVEVTFEADAGDVITYGSGAPVIDRDVELQAPGGFQFPVTPESVTNGWQASWLAQTSGTFRLVFPGRAFVPQDTAEIHTITPVDMSPDLDHLQVEIVHPGEAAAVRMWLDAGERAIPGLRNVSLPDASHLMWTIAGDHFLPAGDGPAVAPIHSGWVTYVATAGDGGTGSLEAWVSRSRVLGAVDLDGTRLPATRTSTERQELGVTFHGEAGQLVTGYTEEYRDPLLQTLTGPDGLPVSERSYITPREVWRLPATGDYTLWTVVDNDQDTLGASTPVVLPEVATDGREFTVTFRGRSETFLVPFTATAGQTITVHAYDPNSSANARWTVFKDDLWNGELAAPEYHAVDTTEAFTAPSTGTYWMLMQNEAPLATTRFKVSLTAS